MVDIVKIEILKCVILCRFGEFLIRLCIEITFSLGSVQIYCYYVQKNCLFWASCRNITVHSGPGTRGYLESRAGPFLGYVKKYCFFGEIFTSALFPNGSLFRDPGPYRDLFWHFGSLLGLYLFFRVPIFSVLASFTRRMST